MTKIAFAGFRHGHIFAMHNACTKQDEFQIVAACEEDAETRAGLKESKKANITHDNCVAMLDEVECDIVACGDCYGNRGKILIEAMKRGKHVIADKPVCTSLDELDEIERLSKEKNLKVGCMLDIRDNGHMRKVRDLIRDGAIGEVHAMNVGGQHPLLYGTRPSWYFEKGKHGGTINDIAIHAMDFVPWITGLEFAEITAARTWNAKLPEVPYFNDCGQFMIRMNNNAGFYGDVSYLMPDSHGYSLDLYWRSTFFGSKGIIETSMVMKKIFMARNGSKEPELLDPADNIDSGYLASFLKDIQGEETDLATSDVLKASRVVLTTQKAALENTAPISL